MIQDELLEKLAAVEKDFIVKRDALIFEGEESVSLLNHVAEVSRHAEVNI